MKTILLTLILLLPLSSIADVPCHIALEIQDSTIKSLETRLATAQSLPYNQGYQEGYKQATLKANPMYKQFLEAMGCIFTALIIACLIVGYIIHTERLK